MAFGCNLWEVPCLALQWRQPQQRAPSRKQPQAPFIFSMGFVCNLLPFARKFWLRAQFSLCCGCHRNLSWGNAWGFLWLGKPTGTGSLPRTSWIPAASFCVGCRQPTPSCPKGTRSCLLKPDRCFAPFECEWGLQSASQMETAPFLYHKGVSSWSQTWGMLPHTWIESTYSS